MEGICPRSEVVCVLKAKSPFDSAQGDFALFDFASCKCADILISILEF